MKLMIINGSVRAGRLSDNVQKWLLEVLRQDSELELDVVDLKEVDLPFFDEPTSPQYNEGNFVNPKGTAWAERVAKADAFIFLVAEYNHGPTAVLKNAVDWVYHGWNNKPVGFISYGGLVGGARAVEQLKQIVTTVKLFPVSSVITIPGIWTAFDESGKPSHQSLNTGLESQLAELKDLQRRLVA